MPQDQLKFESFDSITIGKNEVELKVPPYPVWTRYKAQSIKQYLYYFVLITKHGVYIDGFAGPQKSGRPEMWAAKLAIENEPAWFRKFYLFEMKEDKYYSLLKLKDSQPENIKREIEVQYGDFNLLIHDFLKRNPIGEKEATFCLLDQRTFECKWSTVQLLAGYKKTGYKIELFYFLPICWLDRAAKALKNISELKNWWGRDDWDVLLNRKPWDRAILFKERFEDDFGYKHVKPWPFYIRRGGGRIMYFMIHASDHPDAPKQMNRAYNEVVGTIKPHKQAMFDFANI